MLYSGLNVQQSLTLRTLTSSYVFSVTTSYRRKKGLCPEVAAAFVYGNKHNYLEASLMDTANPFGKTTAAAFPVDP